MCPINHVHNSSPSDCFQDAVSHLKSHKCVFSSCFCHLMSDFIAHNKSITFHPDELQLVWHLPWALPVLCLWWLMSGDEKKGILGLVIACPEIKIWCLKFQILGKLSGLTDYSIGLCTLFLVSNFCYQWQWLLSISKTTREGMNFYIAKKHVRCIRNRQ